MKRFVLISLCAIAASFCALVAPPPAAACYSTKAATPTDFALGLLTYVQPGCESQLGGHQIGDLWYSAWGWKCKTTTSSGASGCSQSILFLVAPLARQAFPGMCDTTGQAILQGIGCCGIPCPPPGVNCQEN